MAFGLTPALSKCRTFCSSPRGAAAISRGSRSMNRPRMPVQLSFPVLNKCAPVLTSRIDNRRVHSLNDHCHAIEVEPVRGVARSVVVPITVESHVRDHDG